MSLLEMPLLEMPLIEMHTSVFQNHLQKLISYKEFNDLSKLTIWPIETIGNPL